MGGGWRRRLTKAFWRRASTAAFDRKSFVSVEEQAATASAARPAPTYRRLAEPAKIELTPGHRYSCC